MLDAFLAQPAVAVDTESNSLYAYYERICLIQFSSPETDYVVDPLADLDLSPLGELFARPAIQKVFHAAEQDVAGMKRDFGFQFANLFDTMWTARILGWPRVGLANVLQERFGVRSDKRYQRYNWGERPLRSQALAYARLDTHYLLPLRELQAKALERMGRAEEAGEVFAHVAQTPPAVLPFGPEPFWRVKGLRDLTGRERAILWELYLWRDQEASRRNRPPFKVLGEHTLVELAQSCPRTPQELSGVYGLKPYHVRRYGARILGAIKRGMHAHPPKPPPPPPRHSDAEIARFRALRAWRKRVAAARGVDTDVVVSNAVLWALAERNPATLEGMQAIEGLGPWKRKTYGEAILRVLVNR